MIPIDPESRLRLATSRRELATPLDNETTALRASFLALGQALEQAATQPNEDRLLAALRETQPVVTIAAPQELPQALARRQMLWIVASAATLLVAVGMLAYAMRNAEPHNNQVVQPSVSPNSPNTVTPDSDSPDMLSPEIAREESPQLAETAPGETESLDPLDWNDSLDDSFATAERLVGQAGRLSRAADAEFVTLRRQMEAASSEVEDDSL